ncbi:MAG: ORF6N domain-containing protein [Bryobacteraceae bacterium]
MPSKPDAKQLATIPEEFIERKIYLIRGQKVMLSPDLADLYEVETRALIQAVKRNRDRFPGDFMFQLNANEYENLKSQFVTSSWGGARRATPYAFTEHGVAMLSSVLRSKRAVQMNVLIIRAFIKLREILESHKDLVRAMEDIKRKQEEQGEQITAIVETINQILDAEPVPPKRRIGF